MCYMGCEFEDYWGECRIKGDLPDDAPCVVAEREWERRLRREHPIIWLNDCILFRFGPYRSLRNWLWRKTHGSDEIPF